MCRTFTSKGCRKIKKAVSYFEAAFLIHFFLAGLKNYYESFLAQFIPQGGALFSGNNSTEHAGAVLLLFCRVAVSKLYSAVQPNKIIIFFLYYLRLLLLLT